MRPVRSRPRASERFVRWAGSLVVIAGLALVAPARGREPASGPSLEFGRAAAGVRPLRESLCLNVKFSQGEPEKDLSNLDDLAVRWVRDGVLWSDVEPSPGTYRPFPQAFARRLAHYRDRGIGVVFILAYGNDGAYPPTPDDPLRSIDPTAFGGYAAEVARQMKASGVRFVLEVWNEPHNFAVRKLAGGAWNGAPPSPWVHRYVRLVEAATSRAKDVDPAITVLDDDDMWILHYRFLEAGLPPALDGFAFHPYTKFWPERAAVTADTDWIRPFVAVDPDASFDSAVRRLREAGAASLRSPPQMWATEWGWKLGDGGPDGTITEDTVAAFLPRSFVLSENAGVRALCWFSSADSVDGQMGLVSNDGTKRKSYFAFRTLSRELGDYGLVRHAVGADHRVSGPQAFLFCRPGADCKLAVWSVDGPDTRLRLTGPLRGVRAIDALGAPVPTARDRRGEPFVPVGRAPIYLGGLPPDVSSSSNLDAAVAAAFAAPE